jgi:uncharacterized protein (DUF2147 family)
MHSTARGVVAFSIAAVAALASPAGAASVTDAAGTWQHPENASVLAFYDCDGDLCAKIAKPTAPGLKDDKNPDESKRGALLEGLVILSHGKKSDETSWKGDLYNATDGKTYSGYVSLLAPDKLQLKGCALLVFCKTIVFSKAAAQ